MEGVEVITTHTHTTLGGTRRLGLEAITMDMDSAVITMDSDLAALVGCLEIIITIHIMVEIMAQATLRNDLSFPVYTLINSKTCIEFYCYRK